MQKNIIEYFVRRPIPAAIAQHNSQKKDPFLNVIIKKKLMQTKVAITMRLLLRTDYKKLTKVGLKIKRLTSKRL